MTVYYVDNAGSNTSPYDTWAKAATTLATISALDAAGDVVYIAHTHTETTNANLSLGMVSGASWICGNTGAAPPTSVAATAVCKTGAGNYLLIAGSAFTYVEGIVFTCAEGGSSASTFSASGNIKSCTFICGSSNGGQTASFTSSILTDCSFKFSAAGQFITITDSIINGGSVLSGGTNTSPLFSGRGIVTGFDMSNMASTMNIHAGASTSSGVFTIRNSKLPASWSGSLLNAAITNNSRTRVEMHNCDSGDTNYKLWVEDYCGSIRDDTGVYNDAGATNGTTRLSWKMVASANANFPRTPLRSPEIVIWNETTGSSKTVTVEIVHDSQGSGANGVLNNDEIWLEVQYLGTSGVPLGTFINDCKSSVLATAAAQTTSSASWTGDSAGWDTQKLEVTFITPQEKGYIHAVVCLAKASATVYVDPLLTVA